MLNSWSRSDKIALGAMIISGFSLLSSVILSNKTDSIRIDLNKIDAQVAEIGTLKSKNAEIKNLEADVANIRETLKAKSVEIDEIKAQVANIGTLKTNRIDFGEGASISVTSSGVKSRHPMLHSRQEFDLMNVYNKLKELKL